MTLILKENEVRSLLTMKDGIRIVEEGFAQYARGKTTLAPRLVMKLEGEAGTFRIMAAIVPEMGGFGLKTLTGTPGKRKADSTYFAMLYFDVSTGALLAVIPATYITGIRTGAASGVATKYLARDDARSVGLFGAGFQGRNQIAAIREVRPIERVKIFDVAEAPARALAKELEAEGVEATVAASPEEAVRGSDIIASATTASEPPIRGAWLPAGMPRERRRSERPDEARGGRGSVRALPGGRGLRGAGAAGSRRPDVGDRVRRFSRKSVSMRSSATS